MNKNYIKPQTEIIEMELQSMIAESITVKDEEVDSQGSKEHVSLPGFDLWDDGEE